MVVIATQRPSLVRYADQMVVLQEGRVVEKGPPSEVLPSPLLGPTMMMGGGRGGGGGGEYHHEFFPPLPAPQQQQQEQQGGYAQTHTYNRQEQQGGGGGGGRSSFLPSARGPVRWGGGSTASYSDGEDDIYLFDR